MTDQLITPEQADRILVRGDVLVQEPPAAQERPHGRSSLVIEALGYLGGAIILVASILIASLYWDQVSTAARLVIVAGVVAVLLAAGFGIPCSSSAHCSSGLDCSSLAAGTPGQRQGRPPATSPSARLQPRSLQPGLPD